MLDETKNQEFTKNLVDRFSENAIEERKKKLQEQRELAESLWEGCQGCDENDKEFWVNGFIKGLNYKTC
jgi:hypothetical protein